MNTLTQAKNADELQEFANLINAKWKEKKYTAIQQAINARLQANANDVLALGTKAYFYVFAVSDLKQARSAIQAFNTKVQASTETSAAVNSAKVIAQGMKDEIMSIPDSEGGAWTTAESGQLHELFSKEFPMMHRILGVARLVP